MKKSLSLLLSIALVFSMFASMASANELSTQDKFDQLKEAGIFTGYEDGSAGLDKDMKRSHFAVVLQRLLDLEDAAHSYTDISASTNSWAGGAIGAVTEAGLMEGKGAGKFDAEGYVKVQELAAIALRALGFDEVEGAVAGKVDTWAAGYVAAALELGLIPAQADYTVFAKRGQLVDVAYEVLEAIIGSQITVTGAVVVDEKTVEVTLSNEEVVTVNLEEALKPGEKTTISFEHEGKTYEVEVELASSAVASVTQTGAKKITVKFNRTLTATEKAELTYTLKSGQINYPVTVKYADDNKSVVLEAAYLPAGDYEVTVKDQDPIAVKVVAAEVTKLEIGASEIQKVAGQDLGIKALDQFGEQVPNVGLDVKIFSSKNGELVTATPSKYVGGKLDASGEDVGNTIVVTVVYSQKGLTLTQTYTVVAESVASSLALGEVAPLANEQRVTAGKEGYVLPYTFVDQYGKNFKLPSHTAGLGYTAGANSVKIGSIDFIVSDIGIISPGSLSVDADGVLKFNTIGAGTVVITALNTAGGKSANVTVKVDPVANLNSLQLQQPTALVVDGEEVIFNYAAADTFNQPIDKKDVPAKAIALAGETPSKFNITFSSGTVTAVTHTWKPNGDLALKFAGSGNATVFVWVNGQLSSQLSVSVNAKPNPVSITGTKDLKLKLTEGATQTLNFSKLVINDSLGRAFVNNGWDLNFTETAGNNAISLSGPDADDNFTVTAANVGSEKVTATLSKTGQTSLTFEITFEVIAKDKVTSFTIDAVPTLFVQPSYGVADGAGYAKTLTLVGKTAEGVEVAIKTSDFFTNVTTTNSSIVGLENSTSLNIFGAGKGSAVVAVWDGAVKRGEVTVAVSDDAPVATTAAFKDATKTINAGTGLSVNIASEVVVKDQYGKVLTNNGNFYSSAQADVAITTAGVITSAVAGKTVTITYIHSTGLTASFQVSVNY